MTETVEKSIRAADAATAAAEAARAARDKAIRDASASGARPVQLVAASELSRSTVHTILRGGAGTTRSGDTLARVAITARAWRDAGQREAEAHAARNVAVAEALDGELIRPVEVRGLTGWGEARVYQVRDLGRAILDARASSATNAREGTDVAR